MNKDRRKAIQKVIDKVADLTETLAALADEEMEYYENMPESFQQGVKGDLSQTASDALESAKDSLDSALDDLQNAME